MERQICQMACCRGIQDDPTVDGERCLPGGRGILVRRQGRRGAPPRWAAILAKLGTPALAAVAGEFVTADAAEFARAQGIWQVTDGAGRICPPRELM